MAKKTRRRNPAQTNEFALDKIGTIVVKQLIIWGPLVVGIVHQILMALFDIDSIYIFVPPRYLTPLISLEYQWWIILLFGSSIVALLAYTERLSNLPPRVALPFYFYVIFLLIIIKPI